MKKNRDPKAVDFVAALRRRGRVALQFDERDEFFIEHCRRLGKINYPRTKAVPKKLAPAPRKPYKRRTK